MPTGFAAGLADAVGALTGSSVRTALLLAVFDGAFTVFSAFAAVFAADSVVAAFACAALLAAFGAAGFSAGLAFTAFAAGFSLAAAGTAVLGLAFASAGGDDFETFLAAFAAALVAILRLLRGPVGPLRFTWWLLSARQGQSGFPWSF